MAATPTVPRPPTKVQRAQARLYRFMLLYPGCVELVLHVTAAQCPAEASYAVVQACFTTFTHWLRRKHPGVLYEAVFDCGRHGWWHIHVVTSRPIPRPEAQAAWCRAGGAGLGYEHITDKAEKAHYLATKLDQPAPANTSLRYR